MIMTIVLFFCSAAQAKWWIFGKSEGVVETRYVYLNGISYDELGPQVILYKDMLSRGMITIKGRATSSKKKIGAVQVSINNRETWSKAKLASDGTFEFSFTPDASKTYVIFLKMIDTTGKANDVDATRKEVTVSNESIQAIIQDALDKLIAAYRNEDPNKFMAFVSEDFAGDDINLDRAVRDDFRAFDNIDLRFTLNNVSSNARGRIFVLITFNRMVISSKSGQSFTDSGMTEFIFVLGDKGPKVYSMKHPLIFGLSDIESVATGVTPQTGSTRIISVDDRGNVTDVPFNDIPQDDPVDDDPWDDPVNDDPQDDPINDDPQDDPVNDDPQDDPINDNPQDDPINDDPQDDPINDDPQDDPINDDPQDDPINDDPQDDPVNDTVEEGFNLVIMSHFGNVNGPGGFTFADADTSGPGDFMITGYHEPPAEAYGFLDNGVMIADLGMQSLNDITQAPESGYDTQTSPPQGGAIYLSEGHCYAFRLSDQTYGLLYVRSVAHEIIPDPYSESTTMRIDYKYQPDRSRNF